MYPGTIVNWHDESYIPASTVDVSAPATLFLVGSSFDRGPEDLRVVNGQNFFDLYGTPSFNKHGQPAIQAANIIRGGGTLLIKRVVSKTATLANIVVIANINATINAVKSTDENDKDAKTLNELKGVVETDDETGEPVTTGDKYKAYRTVSVTWNTRSIQNASSLSDVNTAIADVMKVGDTEDKGAGKVYINSDGEAIPVTEEEITVTDEEGTEGTKKQYKDSTGKIVTKDDGTEITEDDVTTSEVLSTTTTVPMLVVVDNGRGLSNKSVRIIPDYNTSKDSKNFFYNLRVYDGTTVLENATICFNPTALVNDINYAINKYTAAQVVLDQPEKSYNTFIDAIAAGYGFETEEEKTQLTYYDLIFGKTNNKVAIDGYEVTAESIDLNSNYGVSLEQGSNGGFGAYPNPGNPVDTKLSTDPEDNRRVKKDYVDALTWFFYPIVDKETQSAADMEYDYEGSDKIFDLDDYKIAACFDANYPDAVKNAISKLANFREDFFYFRDMGINVVTYQDIKDIAQGVSAEYPKGFSENSRYIGNYCTWYQILDPTSRTRINVTMMYDLARVMINHFANGAYRPLAGFVNNMILDNAIEGTINFTPRITPIANQKTLLDNLRVNYAIFQNGRCIVQSLYTSQEAYTQLSYINNVLGIQEVVRAVRTACPAFRYTFAQQSDFSSYATAVSNVLMNYSSNFAELSFDYKKDALKASQKIFYATISFRFNNWAQTEVFDIYALPDADL